MHRTLFATALIATLAAHAPAATWADAMFEELAFDFGAVPRGPMLTHQYRFTNNSGQRVHISSVRVSCGCTTATALTGELAPGQSSVVLAQMDSRRFIGPKTVTIFVTFDAPRHEEVRLSISAIGRDEVTIEPEGLNFGNIQRGTSPTVSVNVTLRGATATQLTGVVSESNYVLVNAREARRTQFETTFEVKAQLRPDTPIGKWFTDVWVQTTDPTSPRVRVPLTVEVAPALSISPGSAEFGVVKVGETRELKVILRSAQPFRIREIKGAELGVTVQPASQDSRPVHVLSVAFKPEAAGDWAKRVKIVTDLAADGVVELPVRATVSP